jgi:hypothetical protein
MRWYIDSKSICRLCFTVTTITISTTTISKELAKYGWDSDDVKILLSITGIDVFSAMLIVVIFSLRVHIGRDLAEGR